MTNHYLSTDSEEKEQGKMIVVLFIQTLIFRRHSSLRRDSSCHEETPDLVNDSFCQAKASSQVWFAILSPSKFVFNLKKNVDPTTPGVQIPTCRQNPWMSDPHEGLAPWTQTPLGGTALLDADPLDADLTPLGIQTPPHRQTRLWMQTPREADQYR